MKYLFILFLSLSLFGCSNAETEKSMFDENGNLKKEYAQSMQDEWCNHNKNEEFAKERCEKVKESK